MEKHEAIFDDLKDLVFIKATVEGDDSFDTNAVFIDLEEEDENYGLPIVYIDSENDIILSPFSGTDEIYATYRPNVYGCLATDKEFLVVMKQD